MEKKTTVTTQYTNDGKGNVAGHIVTEEYMNGKTTHTYYIPSEKNRQAVGDAYADAIFEKGAIEMDKKEPRSWWEIMEDDMKILEEEKKALDEEKGGEG